MNIPVIIGILLVATGVMITVLALVGPLARDKDKSYNKLFVAISVATTLVIILLGTAIYLALRPLLPLLLLH
jgi:uncharacterized membrane protein YczE